MAPIQPDASLPAAFPEHVAPAGLTVEPGSPTLGEPCATAKSDYDSGPSPSPTDAVGSSGGDARWTALKAHVAAAQHEVGDVSLKDVGPPLPPPAAAAAPPAAAAAAAVTALALPAPDATEQVTLAPANPVWQGMPVKVCEVPGVGSFRFVEMIDQEGRAYRMHVPGPPLTYAAQDAGTAPAAASVEASLPTAPPEELRLMAPQHMPPVAASAATTASTVAAHVAAYAAATGLKGRSTWMQEEDDKLTEGVTKLGPSNWTEVAKYYVPQRTGKQCRERWYNHLQPSVRKGQWTPEEDELIFQGVAELGTCWSAIVKRLPGRTDNAIKNRYHTWRRRQARRSTDAENPAAALLLPPGACPALLEATNQTVCNQTVPVTAEAGNSSETEAGSSAGSSV